MNVSVVIPTFNRAHRLPWAIQSVLEQQLPPREVLVVDDGSTDGTVEKLARHFPNVRFLQQPHRGVSAARNAGIRASRGEWIAFLDSDDRWLPGKLAAQQKALTANPGYLVCHTDEVWFRHGRRVNPKKKHRKHGGWIFEQCLPRCIISPSSVLIHRTVFEQVGCFDESLPVCEDYDLWLRICLYFPVLFVAETQVVKLGGHTDQLSRQVWGMDRFRIQALEKLLREQPLTIHQQIAVRKELTRKLSIYLCGALKRKKWAEVQHDRSRLHHHISWLQARGEPAPAEYHRWLEYLARSEMIPPPLLADTPGKS